MFLLKQLPVWKVVVMTLGFLTGLLKESSQMLESPSPTPTLLQTTGMQLQPEFADLMLLPPASASPGSPPTSRLPILQDHLSASNDHPLQDFGRNVSLGGMFFEEDTPLEPDLVTRVPAGPALGYPPDAIPSLTTNPSTDHSMTATASQRPPLIWVSPSTHTLRHRVEHSRVPLWFLKSPDIRANETSPAELLCSTDLQPSTGVHPLDFSSRVTNLAPTEPIPSSEGASASDYHPAYWYLALSLDGRGITSSVQPEAMSAEPIMGSYLPTTDLPFSPCRWPDVMKVLFEKCGWIFEQWAMGGNALISLSTFSSFLGVTMLLIQLLCKDHRHCRKTTFRPLRILTSHRRLHLGKVQVEFLRGAAAKRLILPIRTAFCLLVLPVIFLPSVGLPLMVWLLIQLWHAVCRRIFPVWSNTVDSLDAETRTTQPSCPSPNRNNSNSGWGQQRSHFFNSICNFFLGNSVDMETDEKDEVETMEIEENGEENMEVDEEVISMETDEVDGLLMKAEEDMDVDLRSAQIMEWAQTLKIRGGWDSTGFHIEQDHVFIRQPLHKTSPCDQLKVFDMEWQGKAGPRAAASSASAVITTPTAVATPASTMAPLPSGIPQPPPLPSPARGPVEISRGGDALKVPKANLLNSEQTQSRTTCRKHPRRHSRSLRAKRDPLRRVAGHRLKHRLYYNKWSQALRRLSPPICFYTASAHQPMSPTGPKLVEDILRQWREKATENDIKDKDIPANANMPTSNSEEKQTYMIDLSKLINELENKFCGGTFTDQDTNEERALGNPDPGNTNHDGSSADGQNNQGSNTNPEAQKTLSEEAKYDVEVPLKKLQAMKISEAVEEEASTADSDSVTNLGICQILNTEPNTVMGGGCDDSHLNTITISEDVLIHQHHCTRNITPDDIIDKACKEAHAMEEKTTSPKIGEDVKTDEYELVEKLKNVTISEENNHHVQAKPDRANEPDLSTTRNSLSEYQTIYEKAFDGCAKEGQTTSMITGEKTGIADEDGLVEKLKQVHISDKFDSKTTRNIRADESDLNAVEITRETSIQHRNSGNIIDKSDCSEVFQRSTTKGEANTETDEEELVKKLKSWHITEENENDQHKAIEPEPNATGSSGESPSQHHSSDNISPGYIVNKSTCDEAHVMGRRTTPTKTVDGQITSVKTTEDTGISDEEDLVRKLKSWKITEENGCDLQTEQGKANEPDSNTTQESPIQDHCSGDITPGYICNESTCDEAYAKEGKLTSPRTDDLDDLVRKLKSVKIGEEDDIIPQSEQNKAEDSGLNTNKLLEDASYYHGNSTTSEMIQDGSLKVNKNTAYEETESNTIVSDEETSHHQGEPIVSPIAQDKASNEDRVEAPCKVSDFNTTNIFCEEIRHQHDDTNNLPVVEEEASVEVDESITSKKSDSNTPTTSGKPSQCHGETRMTQKGACGEVDNEKITTGKSDLNTTPFSEQTSDQQSESITLSAVQDKVRVEADDEETTNEKCDLNTAVINDLPSYCHSDMITSNTIQMRVQFEGNINQENEKVLALGTASEQNVHETKDPDSTVLISAAPIAIETCTSKDELVKLMDYLDISNSEAPHLDASNNHPLPLLSFLMLNTHGKGSRASRQELNFRYLRPTKRLPYVMAHQRNDEITVLEQSGPLSPRMNMRSIKARVKQRAQAVERAKAARSRIKHIQLVNEDKIDQRLLCEAIMRTSLSEPEASTTNSTKETATPDAEFPQQEAVLVSCLDNLMVSEVGNAILKPLQNEIQTSERNSKALKSEPDNTAARPVKKVTFKVAPLCSDEDSEPSSCSRKYGLTSVSRSLLNSKARMEKSRQERREQATERTNQARFQLRRIEVQGDEDGEVPSDNAEDVPLNTQTPLKKTVKPSSLNTGIPEKSQSRSESKSADHNRQISSLAELNPNNKAADYQSDQESTTETENKIPNSIDDADILSQLEHLEVSKGSKPSTLKQETLQREMMLQLNSNGKGSAVTKPGMKFRFARPKKRVTFSVSDEQTDNESGEQSNHASSTQHKNEARRKRREQFSTRAKDARFQNRHIEPHGDDDDSGIDDEDDDDDNNSLPACPKSSTTANQSKHGKAGNSSSQLNSNNKVSTDPSSSSSGPSTSGASTSNNVPHRNSGESKKLDGPLRSNKKFPTVPPREINFRYVRPNGRVTFQVAPLVEEGGDAVNCGRNSHVRPSSPHLSINRRALEKARQKRRDEAQDRARLARFRLRGIELDDDDDGEMLQKDMENISLTMKMIEEQAKKQETKAVNMAKEDQTEASATSQDLMQQLNSNRKGSNEGAVGGVREDTDDEEWGLANQLQHLEVGKNIPSKEQTKKQQRLQRELMLQLNSNNKGTDEEPGQVFHFQASADAGERIQQLNSNNKGSATMKRTEMKFRFERPRKSVTFSLPEKANGGSSSQDTSRPGSTSSTSLCLRLNEARKTRRQLFLERAKHARFLDRQIELSDDDGDNDDANTEEKLPPPSFVADPSETSANPSNPEEHESTS